MKSQLVSANHLWQRPTDLLYLPWNAQSSLQRQIDWYLNFSLSKAFRHPAPRLNPFQNSFIQEVGLQSAGGGEELSFDGQPILCLAPPHFMSKYVVATSPKKRSSLAESFFQTASWLKVSRASIVLPTSVPVEDFTSSLQKLGFDGELFIAVDVAPTND